MLLLSSFAKDIKPKKVQMISSLIRSRDGMYSPKKCSNEGWDVICTIHVFYRALVEFKNRCLFDVFSTSSGPVHEWNGRTN